MTKEPEFKVTPSGHEVVSFSIANNRGKKADGSEYPANFFKCEAWKGLAKIIRDYCHKGTKVEIVGEFQQRSFTRQEDQKQIYYIVLVAHQMTMMDRKPDSYQAGPSEGV
jgi:single-strand DNA-binding protein